jgi:8-oxo-dGTP pyrophosphatase MutT (NUDIX family)
VTELRVGVVDVFVVRPRPDGWRVLALRRGPNGRCPGAWEAVHGSIEPDERPEHAAVREVREETGLDVERLYNVTAHPFYVHATGVVQVAVVFTAFVAEPGDVVLGDEHEAHAWLTVDEAAERFIWPRARGFLRDAWSLLGGGDAGPAEDVLRVF